MDVETAQAQLDYAKAAEEYRAAKLAYQVDAAELADPSDSEKKPAFVEARDAEDVYRRYRTAEPNTHQVFVLWEPYVSKVLENPNTHVVVDSSRFRGYIVDVLVAQRGRLIKAQAALGDYIAPESF